MTNRNGTLVELRRVSQRYQSGERTFTALREIDLSIREGEFVGLLGPSGCGKSTLLRIITGLQASTDGQVLYRGSPLRGINPHAAIVFQTMALFPWLTVQQNVEIALKARGVPREERATRAVALLDKVGLDGFESAYPRELSGGMRQKVGFARAMAVEPELLCLDEPFSALDVLSADTLRAELLELWTSGAIPTRAILLVTHNIEEAVFLADRVIVMEKDPGRVVSELPIELPHPRHRRSPEFASVVDRVYGLLAGQTQPEHVELGTAPGEPGRTRALPHITINDLSGLLEHLAGLPRSEADLYRIASELKIDSDHLLRLAEAAELLGFATIARGDIALTPLGETFADASILARKEIFASRTRRLPIYRWLSALLQAADRQQLKAGVIQRALEIEFPPAEAARQLDTLVSWGRYAELLGYDDSSELISLESAVSGDGGAATAQSRP